MTQVSTARPSALTDLLVGYIAGDVAHDAMARFDDFEELATTPEERLAFARFYLDVLAAGDDPAALPEPAEAAGILSAARA